MFVIRGISVSRANYFLDSFLDRLLVPILIIDAIVFIFAISEIATLATEPGTGKGTIRRQYGEENVTFFKESKDTYNSFLYKGETYLYTTDQGCTTVYVYKSK